MMYMTLRSWGKYLFYIPTALLVGTVFISIVRPDLVNTYMVSQNSQFYSSSQLLFVNLVSFVFIIIVFLIQNTTQSYSASLSKELSNDAHLRFIVAMLIIFLVVNTTFQYLGLGGIYELYSFVFGIAAILYLMSLISFTAYYLDLSNILDIAGRRVLKNTTQDRLFDTKYSPNQQAHQELLDDIILLRVLTQEAIENKNRKMVKSGIEHIESVYIEYIQTTDTTNNSFLKEVNNQYDFLIQSASSEYTRQKYLDLIVRSMGVISRETYRNTNDIYAPHYWIDGIKNIFYTTLGELDRTEAYTSSIQQISRFLVLTLNVPRSSGRDYNIYLKDLDNISEKCIQEGHGVPLQLCLSSYMWQIIAMMNETIKEEGKHPPRVFQGPLNSIERIYVDAEKSKDIDDRLLLAAYYRLNSYPTLVRYYGLYGLHPNEAAGMAEITSSPPEEFRAERRSEISLDYRKTEESVVEYFEKIIETQERISSVYVGTSYRDYYSVYPELLFIFCEDLNFKHAESQTLVKSLTDSLCKTIRSEAGNSQYNSPSKHVIREHISDYILISIYYYKVYDDNSIKHVLASFIDLYENLAQQYGEKNARWLYQLLKLAGSLIHNDPKLTETRKRLDTVLARDFYDPQVRNLSRQIQPKGVQLGYPPIDGMNNYKVSNRQVWKPIYDHINSNLFIYSKSKMERYHRYLERESNWV